MTASASRLHALPLVAALVAAGLAAPPAQAQSQPPDAGQVLREQAPSRAPARSGTATLQLPSETDTRAADLGQRFRVQAVRLQGVTAFGTDELLAQLADVIGQEVSLGTLRNAVARLSAYYRERGHLVARAFVPAQEIVDGVVQVTVLEGRIAGHAIDNRSAVQQPVLERVPAAQPLTGHAVHASAIDRTLLLLADLPGVGPVSGVLRPGAQVGTSDLMIHAAAGPAREGAVTLDNHGNRYTGEHRLGVVFNAHSPTGQGDRLALRALLTDEKLLYGRAAYDRPAGGDGLRVGVALSSSSYELGRNYAALDASGRATTAGLTALYPIVRSLRTNAWVAAALEQRWLKDRIGATASDTDKRARALTLDVYGDHDDGWLGGGSTNWRLSPTLGRLSLHTPAAQAADAAGAQTAGAYTKLQASLSRLQGLGTGTQAFVSLTVQRAGQNLDSSEKFVLGGPNGVRAYPQGEASGDDGWLVSAELRRSLAPGWQASAFYDSGRVRLSHDPLPGTAVNRLALHGGGVGLAWQDGAFSVRAALAWRGSSAAVSAPDRRPRLWLAGSYGF